MCACTETDVRNQRPTALSLAGKDTEVAEKRSIRYTLQVPFPHRLNALYNAIFFCCLIATNTPISFGHKWQPSRVMQHIEGNFTIFMYEYM
jgi:hypothetical protein